MTGSYTMGHDMEPASHTYDTPECPITAILAAHGLVPSCCEDVTDGHHELRRVLYAPSYILSDG